MALGRDEFPLKYRYGRRHSWGCLCSACEHAYTVHAQKRGQCDCEDCANTRLAITRRAKSAKERYGPNTAPAPKVHRHSSFFTETSTRKKGNTVATVNFCERHTCETMAKSPAMGMLVIIPATAKPGGDDVYADSVYTRDADTMRLELCPGCIGELMEWLDMAPAGERPKAYSKPWSRDSKATSAVTADDMVKLSNMPSNVLFQYALEASKREVENGGEKE